MALDLKKILKSIDLKDYNFYDKLTPEEQKELSPFVLMRFVSNAQGDIDVQEHFLEMTNELLNKNHWLLSKDHKPLLAKLFAACGVGVVAFHPYLAAGKKGKADKIEKLLCELYPARKLSDIKLWASLMTKQDKEELFDKMGFDKKQRKEYE